jgi:uncharacterized membrane protein YcfT
MEEIDLVKKWQMAGMFTYIDESLWQVTAEIFEETAQWISNDNIATLGDTISTNLFVVVGRIIIESKGFVIPQKEDFFHLVYTMKSVAQKLSIEMYPFNMDFDSEAITTTVDMFLVDKGFDKTLLDDPDENLGLEDICG